ncbi:metallophosphoesterase [Sphingomonas sp. A2-49]|uniref:metallophosphoesterase n=1 Tax=Sphingomonas sp. A2-49 TaxID=1391375 RepID=UPI0021CE11F9|nr:metallophosphoesterase [Sphingomonas sp. A2-49]MCU6454873.1 metallophosphoesterase [Sphingomonas sp. A2-49]
MMRRRSGIGIVALAGAIAIAALLAFGYREAVADPLVRTARVALPDWPFGAAPVTVALLSDIHIGNAAMDETRLARIVAQVNARHPDLVLLAGDFVAGHERRDARAAPGLRALKGLRAPLGVVAVPGNHDHWTDVAAVDAALTAAHVTVLRNAAIARGPLAIGGVDDEPTRHDKLPQTLTQLSQLDGARIVLGHSPDSAPKIDGRASVMLAGHTHCGQLNLPFVGPPVDVSRYGARYRCGVIREGPLRVIVSAGLGCSVVPLRFRAPPDWWLVTLGPRSR